MGFSVEAVNNLIYELGKKTWTKKHGSHAKAVTKIISNIREGSAFGDIIDPELNVPKAQNKRQKNSLL